MKHALIIKNLTIAYQNKVVVSNVSAQIPYGVMLAIVGPNGAGKSTLLKSLVNLIKPLSGTITIADMPHTKALNIVAYIPQRTTIDWDFPINALEVVLMGLYKSIGWFARPNAIHKKKALHALEMVHLEDHAYTPIGQLSGGQQQRVFLARALVQNASIYLMDEPFVGIDATTETTLLTLMQQLKLQGKTIIIVHHDLHTVQNHFDWLMLLNIQCITFGQTAQVYTDHYLSITYQRPGIMKHNIMDR